MPHSLHSREAQRYSPATALELQRMPALAKRVFYHTGARQWGIFRNAEMFKERTQIFKERTEPDA